MKKTKPLYLLFICVGALLSLLTMPAWAVDWQSVPSRKITLFYPGQASWEWLLTDHKGAALIKAGQTCTQCHEGTQSQMGQKLVDGQLLEPSPIPGKPGSIELEIKTAYDSSKLYVRLEWTPGVTPTDKAFGDFEAMASVMLDNGQVPEITRGGCWGACHDDLTGMASAQSGKDLDKYLVKSRTKMTRKGGADNLKSAEELKNLLDAGFFSEIWQARMNRGQSAMVLDGYVLETRHDHDTAKVSVDAVFNNGKWLVDFSRKLMPNDPTYKDVIPGKTYTVGFAIHDGYVKGRRHYVSFGNTLKLDGGSADLIARKQ